jgi:hypothetical protein
MNSKKTYSVQHTIAAYFLCFVLAFNLFGNNLHQCEAHPLNTETACTEETEKDACHRFIIHHEKSDACDGHHKHLSAKHDDCFACKYFKERQSSPVGETSRLAYSYVANVECPIIQDQVSAGSPELIYLRGPPLLSSISLFFICD